MIDVGPEQVLADSAFRCDSALNITHATNADGTRTLCGRGCETWTRQEAEDFPPGCLTCRRIWDGRRAVAALDAKRRAAGLCVSCGAQPLDGRCPNEWVPSDDGRNVPPRGKHARRT